MPGNYSVKTNGNVTPEEPVTPAPTTPTVEEPVVPQTPSVSQNDSELETLFDPMDQVELLDPDYEEKQKEAVGLDLKSAINQTRDTIETVSYTHLTLPTIA